MKERKKELRNWIAQQKSQYSNLELIELSTSILKSLEQTPEFINARVVFIYHSMKDEVHTHAFIEKWYKQKKIVLPVVMGDVLELRVYTKQEDLAISSFGIAEPIGEKFTDYDSIDLAVIPGVAFDAAGCRLGHGKGYYDKLLPQIKAPKMGICFPFQVVESVPTEKFDVVMDSIIR